MIKLMLFFSVFIFTHTLSQSKKQIHSISDLPMTYVQTNLNTVIPLLKKNIHFAHTTQNKTAEAKTSALLALAYYYNGDYDENIKYSLKINLCADRKANVIICTAVRFSTIWLAWGSASVMQCDHTGILHQKPLFLAPAPQLTHSYV